MFNTSPVKSYFSTWPVFLKHRPYNIVQYLAYKKYLGTLWNVQFRFNTTFWKNQFYFFVVTKILIEYPKMFLPW